MSSSLVIFSVILLYLISGSFQQQQSFYFFMETSLMEAPLIANSNTVYSHGKIYDDSIMVLAYTIMPSQTSGRPGSVVAIAQHATIVCGNCTYYIFTYDLSTGISEFVEVLGWPSRPLPELGEMIAANPFTREIITIVTTSFPSTSNLTFFNPTTGTYRYTQIVGVDMLFPVGIAVLLDVNAQVVYTLISEDVHGFFPIVLQSFDAKSGSQLATFNLTMDFGTQMVYLLIDPQTGTLYGIEGNLFDNITFIVAIDIQAQTTHLVVQIPEFWSEIWTFEPSTSTFYAVSAGRIVTVALDGYIKPISVVPDDSGCAIGPWAIGIGTQLQQQKHIQQAGPEMVYLCDISYSRGNSTDSIQVLSHDINGSAAALLVNVLTLPQAIPSYAAAALMSCFHATADFFIQQAITLYESNICQFLNFVSYSSEEILDQVLLTCDYPFEYDQKMAWNSATNKTILSCSSQKPNNVTWQMAFFEIGSDTNSTSQITLTLANFELTVWNFDSVSQTIFGLQITLNTTTLFAIQYPTGNIYWKLDLSTYAVWTDLRTDGIAFFSETQKLYLIICDFPTDSIDCSIDGGPRSLVEISYSQISASITSISPIGNYSTHLGNFLFAMNTAPSLGGVLWATLDKLFFFNTQTNQYVDIAPFGPGCAGCMVVHDV